MRGVTHTLLGAAVALPIAVSRDPAVAAGCLWFGMTGGNLPDWLDLRSDLRAPFRLKHRGASHGLFTMALGTIALAVILVLIDRSAFTLGGYTLDVRRETVVAWVACFALGVASHLASDACTYSGISPFLPFARTRVWLLPRVLRSRSDGYLDTVARMAAIVVLSFGVVVFAGRWIDW